MIARLALLLALLALPLPAAAQQADDIAASARSVVRVVVIAFEESEIVDFGHGSGFAVAPNRIVTNAHVLALARQPGINIAIGVVPSEGSQSYGARLVHIDQRRDLALLEMEEGQVPPIPLFTGPLPDGAGVVALGYPGNVDLATAQSANDYITPLPPTRSMGNVSNTRTISGVMTLLHTASIARGHSGGPLLDGCGRVIGVNTFMTRADDGDSPFAFAIGVRDLAAFLRDAGQRFGQVASECVSMADMLRRDAEAAEEAERRAEAEAARRAAAERERIEAARAANEETRENRTAIALFLGVFALLGFGGAGIMLVKERGRPAMALGAGGMLFLVGAGIAFFGRPGRDEIDLPPAEASAAQLLPEAHVGRNLCRLVPERSRVTVSDSAEVALDWSEAGCVNGRTQYAGDGAVWRRVLVPNEEQTVALLEFRPAEGEYRVSRYLLGAEAMTRARALRAGLDVTGCALSESDHAALAATQDELRAMLPPMPNERLVYACESGG